jgi:hypothetical protein
MHVDNLDTPLAYLARESERFEQHLPHTVPTIGRAQGNMIGSLAERTTEWLDWRPIGAYREHFKAITIKMARE